MHSLGSGLKTFVVNVLVPVLLAFWEVGPPLRAVTAAVHSSFTHGDSVLLSVLSTESLSRILNQNSA